MRKFSLSISRYVLQAVLPYFIFTWLIISIVLFVQESTRYSDLLFSIDIPRHLVWQLTLAIIPNVIAFTCPIAILVGVVIGVSRMQGDNEMVALRSAGVGNIQIAVPIILLSLLLSIFAFWINLQGVPFAAQIVRRVKLQAAIYKLESPIEPGVFNKEINGLTIYVKKGNLETGSWERVFIQEVNALKKEVRLITSEGGRIDTKNTDSEIVLENATVTTFGIGENQKQFVSENVKNLRFGIQTKRSELIEKLSETKQTPKEMGLSELAQFARRETGKKKTEANILWQRRVLLSLSPLILGLLGLALVTRFSRGGRGFGVFLSLVSLIVYYLLMLIGEQLIQSGTINVFIGSLIPVIASSLVIIWLFTSQRISVKSFSTQNLFNFFDRDEKTTDEKITSKSSFIDLTTGLLDFDLVWNLIKYYALTITFLATIFLIFTAFNLWEYAGTIDNGISLLLKYLFFLLPFLYIQLSPSSLMIATLATYVIKSRQNELVTWTAAGQSVYRLLLPCFILMMAIGVFNFAFQEWVATKANRTQDSLRMQLRTKNSSVNDNATFWVASKNRIYSFDKGIAFDNANQNIKNLHIYEFDEDNTRLQSWTIVDRASWKDSKIKFLDKAEKITWSKAGVTRKYISDYETVETYNPFKQNIKELHHLNINETRERIKNTKGEIQKKIYEVSLQNKYSTLFLPFIITLFTAPFAMSIRRKGNVVTIAYAIGVWLLFMGVTTTFEQFGTSGYLSPTIAVWSPLLLFSILGLYLITKVKT